jgi:cation diffusion facilitator CzcD-associated flavoprotein CzcO
MAAETRIEHTPVLVVGGGPAGLAAGTASQPEAEPAGQR